MRDLAIIEDGSLLICDHVICEVGPTRRVEKLAETRGAKIIDATGRVVMPGFIDSYTNLLEASRKGRKSWSAPRLKMEARERLGWFIRHGTTTLNAMAVDAQDVKVLVTLNGNPLDIVTTFRISQQQSWQDDDPVRSRYRFVSIDCDEYGMTIDLVRKHLGHAKLAGFSTRIRGGISTALAVEFGATTFERPDFAPGDISLLARSSTIAVLTPGSVFRHNGTYGPARALIDAGASIALATAFSAEDSPTVSLPIILTLACTRMQLSEAEAITAATINAAHAVGLARLIGSLEVGKQADLLILHVADYRELLVHFGVNLVAMTMKRGRILYREAEIQWRD